MATSRPAGSLGVSTRNVRDRKLIFVHFCSVFLVLCQFTRTLIIWRPLRFHLLIATQVLLRVG